MWLQLRVLPVNEHSRKETLVSDEQAIATIPKQGSAIVRVAGNVLDAFKDYQELQRGLDAAMPEALITIQGRVFRRKPYWRAVARAFNLSVEQVSEGNIGSMDEKMQWGFSAVYRATAPNGAHADGDGACMAKEKYSQKKGWSEATVHNVRSMAHTRAFARAVSNLVGFGEVSAEEIDKDAPPDEPGSHDGAPPQAQRKPEAHASDQAGPVISDGQRKRLYAILMSEASKRGLDKDAAHAFMDDLCVEYKALRTTEILRSDYDAIVKRVEAWK